MLSKLFTVLVVFSFSFSLFAAEESLKGSLVKVGVDKPLINEFITINPIENHHFNLEAPQDCGADAAIKKTARKIKCQFHKAGDKKVTVSVCDNEKKYCKQEYLKFSVQNQESKTPRMKQPPREETSKMQSETKKKLMQDFHAITVEDAKKMMGAKKGALVLVSTDWCPPCNIVKEFLLPTKQFKELTKDYLLVYIDGDGPLMEQWREQLGTFFYPSFVVTSKFLEPVDIKTGDMRIYKFTQWFESSTSHISDSYKFLKARVDARLNGSWWQKVKDLMLAKEDIKADQRRLIDYLWSIAKHTEMEDYINRFQSDEFKFQLKRAQYSNLWFGERSSELDKETREQKKQELVREVLNGSLPENIADSAFIQWLIADHCDLEKIKKEKESLVTKEHCQFLVKRLRGDIKKSKQKIWDNLTDAEKLIVGAEYALSEAKVSGLSGEKEKSKVAYSLCRSLWQKAADFSPLKSLSRASRIEQLSCLKGDDNKGSSLALLQSLIKDYPYESTFYGKVARVYMKDSKFAEALKVNEKALAYSYGDMWAADMSRHVDILTKMGRKKQALQFLEVNMKEIKLDQKGNKNWFMNKIRAQLKSLKSDSSKEKTKVL